MNAELNLKSEKQNVLNQKSRRVLVVEDDQFWREIINCHLRLSEGPVDIEYSSNVEDAVDMVKTRSHYDLIISDYKLNGLFTGLDFWKACQDLDRDSRFILTSGYSRSHLNSDLQEDGPRFITKANLSAELGGVLRNLEMIEQTVPIFTGELKVPRWSKIAFFSFLMFVAMTLYSFIPHQTSLTDKTVVQDMPESFAKSGMPYQARQAAGLKPIRTQGLVNPELQHKVNVLVARMDDFLTHLNADKLRK